MDWKDAGGLEVVAAGMTEKQHTVGDRTERADGQRRLRRCPKRIFPSDSVGMSPDPDILIAYLRSTPLVFEAFEQREQPA